ncbi:MAG: sugar phosphate isomerase/epimerase [Candidatus Sumerlaeia bacterium]|nr:sugar phosphate isomerase/epimerase [Candidatus Sumerlaeia bacterium]
MKKSHPSLSRRQWLAAGIAASTLAGVRQPAAAAPSVPSADAARKTAPFRFCLNTGTVRGLKLGIEKEIEIAAKAGYDAIEPWVDGINNFVKGGGSLSDLRKKIADSGLTVENVIGFPAWGVDDDAKRAAALEQLKRDMETAVALGAKRIAAPPSGINNAPPIALRTLAERYRAVCELGDAAGIVAILELWGAAKNLSRLSDGRTVVVESGHPKACLLPDVFHIYKSGGDFAELKQFKPAMIPVFHMNDYPATPPREQARDSDRVYPGDGIAPLSQILRDLADSGGGHVLSLELFNPNYWKNEPLEVAKTGLEKMKNAVAKALAG